MELKDFDFYLPAELIAQEPPEVRGESSLMLLDKSSGKIEDMLFSELPDLLQSGDVLVLNDSKVMPARLYGIKRDTKAAVEIVLLKDLGANQWECLVKPGRRLKKGTVIDFGQGRLATRVMSETDYGGRIVEFIDFEEDFHTVLSELGEMPLPPYITKKLEDADRYQTVYAKKIGSAAAPTAGLHFTESLIRKLQDKGVHIHFITLHVGLGTFRPVKTDRIEDHRMHEEYFEISQETVKAINLAKKANRKVVAVGTTCVRTLESAAFGFRNGSEMKGWTDIFIYPGYQFKIVDEMITNFHLPKSTLIMMVSAFAGRETILNAYHHAIANGYRFFSFGDAMYIF